MNTFQSKTIIKAIESIDDAESGKHYRHKLDEWERAFIGYLSDQPESYELSLNENHKLNKIREKL